MSLAHRRLGTKDLADMWHINEQGLPGVGKVDVERLRALVEFASHPLGIWAQEELVGFVLCLPPGCAYQSPNYTWFVKRYPDFLYVDRIAIRAGWRDQGLGSALYRQVFEVAARQHVPVAAEVNIRPPNPGSMRFHERLGFNEVGRVDHGAYAVSMVMRPPIEERPG